MPEMKPILFNTDMVRAILANRKTVTRRVVKSADQQWRFDGLEVGPAMLKIRKNGEEYPVDMSGLWATFESDGYPEYPMVKASYQPGDILYVRETFCHIFGRYVYRADYGEVSEDTKALWKPSIHMPKKAARLFLRVTAVRVERLQDMTDEDAVAEGFASRTDFIAAFLKMYPECTEESWVWVIEFERISKEEATQ